MQITLLRVRRAHGKSDKRSDAFNTVRYSETILEANGISIETWDLSEVLSRIERMNDTDDAAQAMLASIKKYGFEHHVAANLSSFAGAVHEAASRSLGWETYSHDRPNGAC
jgi:L-fucose isomerase-like protein